MRTTNDTTDNIRVCDLESLDLYELANHRGIRYSGDVDIFNHDGYFYSVSNWKKYGYASCVVVYRCDGKLYAESGTINRPSEDDVRNALRYCGLDEMEGEPTPEMEIESVKAYWGHEVDEDFSGRYAVCFDGQIDEEVFWSECPEVVGWINGLVND